MRKRVPVVLGGGVVLLVASQYFDFGLGFRDGSGPADPTQDAELASIEEALFEVEDGTPEDATIDGDLGGQDSPEETMVPVIPKLPLVVDVLIDGNQYWVSTNALNLDQREAKTIDEILEMATIAPGEPSGIRVRIARTPDAIAAAEGAVLSRLSEAGMTNDEIDSRRQLVERNP